MGMGRAAVIAAAIGTVLSTAPARAAAADLLVSNYWGSNILRYDGATGVYKGVFASGSGLGEPYGIVYGPDRHLYVSSAPFGARQILRFHGTTGAFLGVFASGSGLHGNKGLTFGPDGNLYVANSNTHEVLRFDGRTGAPLPAPGRAGAVFATGGGLQHTNDCAFGPDGHLYVVGSPSSRVYRFDGTTGAFMDVYASGPEYAPRGLEAVTFGPGGRLYVYDCDTVAIWREDGLGGFEVFVSNAGISQARGHIIFGPDAHLYVGDNAGGSSRVLRFHGQTGAALPAPGRTGSDFAVEGGLNFPGGLAFMLPANSPPVANAGPDQTVEQASAAGTQVTFDGSGSSDPDGNPLTYRWTWPGGSATGGRPTVTLPLGTTTVTLVVNDGQADSEPDTVNITVQDTMPPVVGMAPGGGIVQRVSLDWTVVHPAAFGPEMGSAASMVAVLKVGGVYKAWHAAPGSASVTYHESADGRTWGSGRNVYTSVLSNTSNPEVVMKDGLYHMWMGMGRQEYATSPDGVRWTYKGMITPSGIRHLSILPTPTGFEAWFCGDEPRPGYSYATSGDGIHWQDQGVVIPRGAVNEYDYYISGLGVTKIGSTYHMWYACQPSDPGNPGLRIAYATSPDGKQWQKHGLTRGLESLYPSNPPVGNLNFPCPVFDGSVVKMWLDRDSTERIALVEAPLEEIVLPPPSAIVVEQTNADGTQAPIGRTVALDVCDAAPIVTNDAPAVFPLGETIVTWTATDASGNVATAIQTVTVIDTTPPSLAVPDDFVVEQASAGGTPVEWGCSATDICDTNVDVICNPPSGSTFQLGTWTVICTATDDSGNRTTKTFTVTVLDTTPPVLVVPEPIVVEQATAAGTQVEWVCSATDICDAAPDIVCVPPSGTVFPLGPTVVTCTATDDSGYSTTKTFTVTVLDTTPPVLVVPEPIVVEQATGDGTRVEWQCLAADVCDAEVDVVCEPPSGSVFPHGVTTVTCTATDDSGNVTTKTFTITVFIASQGLEELIGLVWDFLGDKPGTACSLATKLENAIRSLEQGNENAAVNQIEAFINEVEAQRGKKLTEAEADLLIERARSLISALGGRFGRVLRYDGVPVPGVTVFSGFSTSETDSQGYFLKQGPVLLMYKQHAGMPHWTFRRVTGDTYEAAYLKSVFCQQIGVSVWEVTEPLNVLPGFGKLVKLGLSSLFDITIGVKAIQDLDDIAGETEDGGEGYVTGWMRGYVEIAIGNFDLTDAIMPVDVSVSHAWMVAKHPDHDPSLGWDPAGLAVLSLANPYAVDADLLTVIGALFPQGFDSGDVLGNAGLSTSLWSFTLLDWTVQTPAECTEYRCFDAVPGAGLYEVLGLMALRSSLYAGPVSAFRPLVDSLARHFGLWRNATGTKESQNGNWTPIP